MQNNFCLLSFASGLLLGAASVVSDCGTVTDAFVDAANKKRLTPNLLCAELARENGYIDYLNGRLVYQQIVVASKEKCPDVFQVVPK